MSAITPTGKAVDIGDCRHWNLLRDEEDLLWLCLDCDGASTNTLSSSVLEELEGVIGVIDTQRPRGLVVYSAKASGFAAGADINEFDQMSDPGQTAEKIDAVHAMLSRLERFAFPTVAVVHGFCLGGGLELALACRHIIALDDHKMRLGFPEVLLGIHPGFGGTVRSIQYCGAPAALDLMLTGRTLNARRARAIGLIDRAVPARHLESAARRFATKMAPRRQPKGWHAWTSHALIRPMIAAITRRQVGQRAREAHYPAPYAVIELWRQHGGDAAAMYRAEARSIAQLLTTPTSQSLVRLFKLQERLKQTDKSDSTTHVHVVGAGTMGGDIAAWCALQGMQVTLEDQAPKNLGPAFKRSHKLFGKKIRDKYERMRTTDRLMPDFNGRGIEQADVIIEAIIEDVAVKQALFKSIEARARSEAIIATNTSSIQLDEISAELEQPERLVGIHFFNPVAQMQLVEIIGSATTSADVVERAAAFTVAIGRLPLPAVSAPGFLINRVLSPYLQEAITLHEEGIPVETIDRVARDFGMPMGPLELADTVGLDICLHVGEILATAFGGEIPAALQNKVRAGDLGKKSGSGFYQYPRKTNFRISRSPQSSVPDHDIRDRMILRLVNEAVACLREGIVSDADLVDVGMVFGTGFAPFRGGPLAYARDRGAGEITERLATFKDRHGDRFEADEGWRDFDKLCEVKR